LAKIWRNWNFFILLVGAQNGEVAVKTVWQVKTQLSEISLWDTHPRELKVGYLRDIGILMFTATHY
jgi:hypothetical protein